MPAGVEVGIGLALFLVGFALGLISRPYLDEEQEAKEARGRRRHGGPR